LQLNFAVRILQRREDETAWRGLAPTTQFLTTDLMQFLQVLLILSWAMSDPKGYTKTHWGLIGDVGISPAGA